MAGKRRMEKLLGFLERLAGGQQDDSDEQQLNDSFATVPPSIASPIAAAGGNPRRVVEWFECDSGKVYRFALRGRKAVQGWLALRERFPKTGYWPIILGPDDAIRRHNNALTDCHAQSVREITHRAEAIDGNEWSAARLRHWLESDPEYCRPHGVAWPDETAIRRLTQFSAPQDVLTGHPLRHVWMGLLPVRHPCEAAAVMRFGDWNAVPPPEVHVALHRRWHGQFGAELVSMTNDIIEFQVAQPPTTREEATRLAELHYDYCEDVVDQGVGSIEALAATLLGGNIWYFWWD